MSNEKKSWSEHYDFTKKNTTSRYHLLTYRSWAVSCSSFCRYLKESLTHTFSIKNNFNDRKRKSSDCCETWLEKFVKSITVSELFLSKLKNSWNWSVTLMAATFWHFLNMKHFQWPETEVKWIRWNLILKICEITYRSWAVSCSSCCRYLARTSGDKYTLCELTTGCGNIGCLVSSGGYKIRKIFG